MQNTAAIEVGYSIRDRFGGMGRFKGELTCKRWVNSVIINAVTEINNRCHYMYTISALYQINNLNVST